MATDEPGSGDSTATMGMAVVGIIAIVLLMSTCGGTDRASGPNPAMTATPTAVPASAITATPTAVPTPSSVLGSPVSVTAVEVVSVPADEGFWIGTGGDDRVWVELTGRPSESPYDVDKGDRVSFTGHVVANAKGFAARSGVTDAEGRRLLTAQGRHIQVDKDALQLIH